MAIIEAIVKKDKVDKKIIYSFVINNETLEAHYFFGKKASLEITHNGVLLGTINNPKIKHDYIINQEANPTKITAWIDNGNSFSAFMGKLKGIGIEIDGKPVQHTLSDPETHIKNGRSGLYFLLFILGFKCIWTYYINFKEYTSHIVAGISTVVYFVPLIIVLVATIQYARWTTFAIITGIILAVLELFDYAMGIPNSITSGTNGASLLIWILIRISALCMFYNAWKWKRKKTARPTSMLGAS
jgi:hypothetical protein